MEINAVARLKAGSKTEELRKAALQFKMNLTKTGFWEAKSDAQDKSIHAFLNYLKEQGFKYVKVKGGSEYEQDLVKGNVRVRYSARYGKGYQAILGIEE